MEPALAISVPFSAAAKATRSSRARRHCSIRCCHALHLTSASAKPADLRRLFAIPVDDVRLEIGFGGAEHLVAQAQAHLRTGFIGTDAFVNAIAKALVAIEENTLANIRLHFGDASELLDWLPDAVPFADRSALSRSLAEAAALETAVHPGRKLEAARAYFEDRRRAALRHRYCGLRGLCVGACAAFGRFRMDRRMLPTTGASPGPASASTRYEMKAKREGRRPAYFIFPPCLVIARTLAGPARSEPRAERSWRSVVRNSRVRHQVFEVTAFRRAAR